MKHFSDYMTGTGLDVGSGPTAVAWRAKPYDIIHGCVDAQTLPEEEDASYDFVHSAHCLEHVRDPLEALLNWWRVLRPGGHLLLSLPDEDLYEQHIVPSVFNIDHKVGFTAHKDKSWHPASLNILDLVRNLPAHRLIKLEIMDARYDRALSLTDQTWGGEAEAFVELIVQKQVLTDFDRKDQNPDTIFCPNCDRYLLLIGVDGASLLLRCTTCGTLCNTSVKID